MSVSIISSATSAVNISKSKYQFRILDIPFFIYATAFASLSIVIGLIWDISWHTSIGRDGLFSPPHLAIYLGAVVAGFFSGYQVLKTSFWSSRGEKENAVKFWGIFYGSLGAQFCIWGCIAMLTSAPFDDWWHNTYGLDVVILSPPHSLLALGMMIVQVGAMVSVVALQNKISSVATNSSRLRTRVLQAIFVITAGFFLVMLFTIGSAYQGRSGMHYSVFYVICGFLYPLILATVAKASQLKWAASIAASVYMAVLMIMVWILPLFSAEPLLGPILNDIDRFTAFEFPLILIGPALCIDFIMQRFATKNKWLIALLVGPTFILVMLVIHWPFGDFLMSPYARNWFFGQGAWGYGSPPNYEYRYAFRPDLVSTGWGLVKGLLIAATLAILSTRIGLAWGSWMKNIKR